MSHVNYYGLRVKIFIKLKSGYNFTIFKNCKILAMLNSSSAVKADSRTRRGTMQNA